MILPSIRLLILSSFLLGLTGPAVAGELGVQVAFTSGEISAIRAYYRDHAGSSNTSKGKGRGGAKSLPPGIEKNLQRGKALPPGIAKQVLPGGLVAVLPPPPRGFERIEVAGKVLLVEVATQVIHDVLEDIVFGH